MRLFHLVEQATWDTALRDGSYPWSTRGVTLADEGFVHCSFDHQVAATSLRFYADVDDLLLLEIDGDRLGAPVVVEQLDGAPEPFPHIYGPLDLDAVVATHRYRAGDPPPQV